MEVCPLTNHNIDLKQFDGKMLFHYTVPELGTIWITDVALGIIESLDDQSVNILRGILRKNKDEGKPPIEINAKLLSSLENQNIPYEFEAKARYFLKYLYDHGGPFYETHNFKSSTDCSIIYSSKEEFDRVIRYLEKEELIEFRSQKPTNAATFYQGLGITKKGITEIQNGMPRVPMIGLVNQEITTGDSILDGRINYAREMFFSNPPTFDKMRSACETLIFIMEPLREELKGMFNSDTEQFFQIVNQFAVRHNKERTKKIDTPEQFEWLFYSLLNTINTYVKMKRLGGK